MKSKIVGRKTFRLRVLSRLDKKVGRHYLYSCVCDCGNKIEVMSCNLSGHTKSCGCISVKHGMCNTRIYRSWQNMISRCKHKSKNNIKYYQSRGISVCDSWLKFINFYKDMGKSYIDGLTLDRIDNDKGYSKDNCRWANYVQQGNNKRPSGIYKLSFDIAEKIRSDFSESPQTSGSLSKKYGVSKTTIVNIMSNKIYRTTKIRPRFRLSCKKCGISWIPFVLNPKSCAKCGTVKWKDDF